MGKGCCLRIISSFEKCSIKPYIKWNKRKSQLMCHVKLNKIFIKTVLKSIFVNENATQFFEHFLTSLSLHTLKTSEISKLNMF